MAEENFYPYPPSMPIEEVRYLLGFLRKQDPELPQAVHALWCLAGYAASQITAAPGVLSITVTVGDPEKQLERELSAVESGPTEMAGLDWRTIMKLAMSVLAKWLG